MSCDLRFIHPDALHQWWDIVRDDIDECRKHDDSDVWPEDIYHELKSNEISLHVLWDDEYKGMCVLQPVVDRYSGRKSLHVWFARNRGADVMDVLPQIEDIARSFGADEVTATADAMSYARLSERYGFELTRVELRRDING